MVAKFIWGVLSELCGLDLGANYESVAKMWLSNKKFQFANIITSAVIWCLWKMRNELCFQGEVWTGTDKLLRKISRTLKGWLCMYKEELGQRLEDLIKRLEDRCKCPLQLKWKETTRVSSLLSDRSGVLSSAIVRVESDGVIGRSGQGLEFSDVFCQFEQCVEPAESEQCVEPAVLRHGAYAQNSELG